MATTQEYIAYVCSQIEDTGAVRFKKMFGEYMVYVDDKPVLLVCDNTVYVKPLDAVAPLLGGAQLGAPYEGAKPHYILDIDDEALSRAVVRALLPVVPVPKPRRKKAGDGKAHEGAK